MNIESVKQQLGGTYLVNGSLMVPSDPGNRHYRLVQKWLAEGNTPEPEYTSEELLEKQKQEEEAWRDAELKRVDERVKALEDEGKPVGALRAYRVTLRKYTESPSFPNAGRPKAPPGA